MPWPRPRGAEIKDSKERSKRQFNSTQSKRKGQDHALALGQSWWPAGTTLWSKEPGSLPQHFPVPPWGDTDRILLLLAKKKKKKRSKAQSKGLFCWSGRILQACPGWGGNRVFLGSHRVTQPPKNNWEKNQDSSWYPKNTLVFYLSVSLHQLPVFLFTKVKRC